MEKGIANQSAEAVKASLLARDRVAIFFFSLYKTVKTFSWALVYCLPEPHGLGLSFLRGMVGPCVSGRDGIPN